MRKRLIPIMAGMLVSVVAQANSPYLSKVYEYAPAPGQFVNMLPEYEEGDDAASMAKKAEEGICHAARPGMITLGAFGGYVIVGFDHPVVNLHGRYDFKIYGNSFYSGNKGEGGAEPGIVMVSVDANGNGLPDDEWYELAGSMHGDAATMRGFSIRYYRPEVCREPEIDPSGDKVYDPDPDYKSIIDRSYIRFTTNDGSAAEGFLQRNTFHTQPYWPQWVSDAEIAFSGTRLPDNVTPPEGGIGNFFLEPFEWGYADNLANDMTKGFSLDWAVDAEGRPVTLTHADFFKVYTGVSSSAGWLGEVSTEVAGGEDLHPEAVYSPEWPDNPEIPGTGSVSQIAVADFALISVDAGSITLRSVAEMDAAIYDVYGRCLKTARLSEGISSIDISDLPAGVMLLRAGRMSVKCIK